MFKPEYLIIACWLVFVAVWMLAAAGRKQTAEREGFARRLLYLAPLILGAALIFKGFSHTPIPGRLGDILLPQTTVTAGIGLAVAFVGLLLAIWARMTLGHNWSPSVVVKQDHALVMNGP